MYVLVEFSELEVLTSGEPTMLLVSKKMSFSCLDSCGLGENLKTVKATLKEIDKSILPQISELFRTVMSK